jgi:Zn-dependent protease
VDLPESSYAPVVRKIIAEAQRQALLRQSPLVEPEHLLLGVLATKDTALLKVLDALGHDSSQLRQALEARMPLPAQEEHNTAPAGAAATAPLSPAGDRVVRDAIQEARHLGHAHVESIHMFMGILYDEQSVASEVLREAGITLYDVRVEVLQQPGRFKRHSPRRGGLILPSPIFLALVGVMVGCGLGLYLGVGAVSLLSFCFIVSGWVVSLCIHEFGHALAAYLGGDTSVRDAGYLTLNPFRYTQPVLSILLPLLILFLGGLGLPGGAVYVNRHLLRSAGWSSLVSAAGPLGTVLCGLLVALLFRVGFSHHGAHGMLFHAAGPAGSAHFWVALSFLGFLQVTALFLNLLPIPPLDGFGILEPHLPPGLAATLRQYSGALFLLLLVMLWMGGPVADVFWDEVFMLTNALGIPVELVPIAMDQFMFWEK